MPKRKRTLQSQWIRNCPKCNNILFYSCRSTLQRAIRIGTNCTECRPRKPKQQYIEHKPLERLIRKYITLPDSLARDLDDIVQLIHIKLLKYPYDLWLKNPDNKIRKRQQHIHSYIQMVTKHVIISEYRRKMRYLKLKKNVFDINVQQQIWFVEQPSIEEPMHIGLHKAISQLSNNFRTIIKMYYFDELIMSQISEKLDIEVGTVKSRLHRAKTKLHKLLQLKINTNSDKPS